MQYMYIHTHSYEGFSLSVFQLKKKKENTDFHKVSLIRRMPILEPIISYISSMTLAREMMFIWTLCMNLVSNHICLASIAKNHKGQLTRAWSTIEASDISLYWRPALLTLKKAKKQLLSYYFCLVYWHFFLVSLI